MTLIVSRLLTALVLMVCATSAAVAQPARTFVASTGSDGNACSIAAPCRTLQKGIDTVAAGGDVLILDSGGFGSNVMITKSVSVLAPPGGQSRVVVPSGGGFGVTVDGSGISVALSGIGVSGSNGIAIGFQNGTALSLRDIDISGTSDGVSHTAGGGHLTISDTQIRARSICFISTSPSAMSVSRTLIIGSRVEGCEFGFQASDYSTVTIRNSVAMASATGCTFGFLAGGSSATLTLDGIVSNGCAYGAVVNGEGSKLSIANSTLVGSVIAGFTGNIGPPEGRTYGNNRIFGNITDALTGFTPIAEQ